MTTLCRCSPRPSGRLAIPALLAATSVACITTSSSALTCPLPRFLHHKPHRRRHGPSVRGSLDRGPLAPNAERTTLATATPSSSRPGPSRLLRSHPPLPTPPGDVERSLATLRRRFRPGDYYVWAYRDDAGAPTSYERYRILAADGAGRSGAADPNDAGDGIDGGSTVLIEMATKFDARDEFAAHHRMTVDLRRHLLFAADDRRDWRLERFEYLDPETEEWTAFGAGDNVQAFEEKFDAFAMLRSSSGSSESDEGADGSRRERGSYRGRNATMNSEPVELIRSGRHSYTEAWYGPITHDALSGVALAKEFEAHTFSLIAVGRDGEDETPVCVVLRENLVVQL